ncbi:MAG: zinc ribbon domain-containing protein [Vallitaleaceae bacterium]|nr:zinc ribbon domain-containing protein [Vallitaleaceae bacterium]
MAAFFDKMKESLNKGTTIVSAKSQTLLETNRVKSEIANLEKQKNAAINEIGRKMYEMKKAGDIDLEQIEEIFVTIFDLEQQLASKEAEKDEILRKEEEKLSMLNQTVEPKQTESVVEPMVVEPIDVEAVPVEPTQTDTIPVEEVSAANTQVCSCGASIPAGAKFCIGCGKKVEE